MERANGLKPPFRNSCMHYRHAGQFIFWIVVIVTLLWALYGRLDVAAVIFLSGLVFVEQAFVAARAQETAPFEGRMHLGALDAKIVVEPKTGFFARIEWEADFKDWQPPFVLRVTARHEPHHVKEKVEKALKKLQSMRSLQDVVIDGRTVAFFFRDEPGKTPGAKESLAWLEKALR